jgi:hypothetical protein
VTLLVIDVTACQHDASIGDHESSLGKVHILRTGTEANIGGATARDLSYDEQRSSCKEGENERFAEHDEC